LYPPLYNREETIAKQSKDRDMVQGTLDMLVLKALSQLFGVAPIDPISYGVACALLFALTLLASYIPARRAARVDPLSALRAD
jgi:ABC-type lipoprotein release transport system permease subunit